MKIKLVVFDIAGTTLQDNEDVVANSFTTALSNHGIELKKDDLSRVMGYRKIDAINMILSEEGIEQTEEEIDQIHTEFLNLINKHYSTAEIHEIGGASDVFDVLKSNGIKVAINTGFSKITTSIIVDRMGWKKRGLIDAFIASDEVAHGRPAADMINKLMADLKIESSHYVAKVGDTPSDLMEGTNAKCGLTIGVLYGTHTREQLIEYPHDYLIKDIKELKSIILDN
jgi:phosphonatase-like hydrolase